MGDSMGEIGMDGMFREEDVRTAGAKAREMAGLRDEALAVIRGGASGDDLHAQDLVREAVWAYCASAHEEALDMLLHDGRMPRGINYLERYNALLGMDDRSEVIRRLEQTISKAESILDEAGEVDIEAAMASAACLYASRVRELVGEVLAVSESDGSADARPMTGTSSESDASRCEDPGEADTATANTTYTANLACVSAKDPWQSDDALGYGETSTMPMPQTVFKPLPAVPMLDVSEVRTLAHEVWRSFDTFKQVVQDNGLFAAFAPDDSYGGCNGWRTSLWWDGFRFDLSEYEGEIPGRATAHDIPSRIEGDDDGEESLETSIERMRSFNRRRYWGMLDDEFEEHVEAFWYGFKVLMKSVNGLYRIDSDGFDRYCMGLAEEAERIALAAGAGFGGPSSGTGSV